MKKITVINCISFIVFISGIGVFSQEAYSQTCDEGELTFYFPTYDEKNVKPCTDSTGWVMLGIPPDRPNDSLSVSYNKWFSKYLCRMGESVIFNGISNVKNVIRFSHFGSWSSPYSCRIEQKNSNVYISYNQTRGDGNLGDRDIEIGTKKINIEKWNLVVEKMESIDFWKMETHDKNLILDGAEWVFEALIDGQYHFVMRNSPDVYDDKEYAELCNLLIQIYVQ